MLRLLSTVALFAALAAPAFSQGRTYMVEQRLTPVASAAVVTVQLPAGTLRNVVFTGVSVYCSVQCEFTVERDGTLATATARTPPALNAAAGTGVAVLYYDSNAGVGTTVARHVVPAGQTIVLELIQKTLTAGQNLTIRTAVMTGTVITDWQYRQN